MAAREGEAPRMGKIRPPRRIIRPLVGRDPAATVGVQETWKLLRDAFRDIHNKNCSALAYEVLYRAAYKIVLNKKGEMLYRNTKQFEEAWFEDKIVPEIKDLVSPNMVNITLGGGPGVSAQQRRERGEIFLRGIRDAWEDFRQSSNMVADILDYLDRYWTSEVKEVPVFLATVGLFRDKVLRAHINPGKEVVVVFDVLASVVLDQINMERDGDVIDRSLIRSCMYMLEGLYERDMDDGNKKLYTLWFQPVFLQRSEEFFKAECDRLLLEGDASAWLRQARKRLHEETERCSTMLPSQTLDAVTDVVDKQLISAHLDNFLALESSGLRWMLDNDKETELGILYNLISRVDPKKTSLVGICKARVVELGLKLEIEKTLKDNSLLPNSTSDSTLAPAAPAAASTVQGEGEGEGEDGEEGSREKGKSAQQQQQQQQQTSAAALQTAAAVKWVEDVLALKQKFDRLWSRCFQEDLLLQAAITKAFSEFINVFGRASEFASLFIDDYLKRGIRGKTDMEVTEILDKAITIIRFLQDKDLFERYYQKHLARRLLHARSESHDVEREMIARMKQELGNRFTSKFEAMFKDLATSTDLTAGYREHVKSLGNSMDADADADEHASIELVVNVLTANSWPPEIMGRPSLSPNQARDVGSGACTYPPEIQRLQSSLTAFYLKNRSGRKLTWIASAGSADIKCTFPAIAGRSGALAKERRYELTVPTYGMVVLMLFNDTAADETLSFEEIRGHTGIPTLELQRTLTALALAPRSRVLIKTPAGKAVRPSDRFGFNLQFSSKSFKIRAATVNAVSKVEALGERRETEDKNNQTRAYVIDAAVVRTMKQRQVLSHSALITEVITQLASRFHPDVALVKKRLEDLIAREYLERVEDEATPTYRYLA